MMEMLKIEEIIEKIPEPAAPEQPAATGTQQTGERVLKPQFGYCDEFEKAYPKKK
jgi:hypothetical protein